VASPTDRPAEDGARIRLLILHAEPARAVVLAQRLPRDRYDVISSPISAATERWVDELGPQLILALPEADPEALLAACAAARSLTEAPVVALSELSEELLVARAFETGIDDYLVLPIGERELEARLQAILRRAQRNGALPETRRVAGMELCATDHSVTRGGERIYLSPIEFRLLACLASAPGRVLTHQTLMSRVWGAEYVDSRHYLRVYIRYLREKLEDDPTRPRLIVSEWGVGYRLAVASSAAVGGGL
jgi:two-component system KDP operon response regulator KdpE